MERVFGSTTIDLYYTFKNKFYRKFVIYSTPCQDRKIPFEFSPLRHRKKTGRFRLRILVKQSNKCILKGIQRTFLVSISNFNNSYSFSYISYSVFWYSEKSIFVLQFEIIIEFSETNFGPRARRKKFFCHSNWILGLLSWRGKFLSHILKRVSVSFSPNFET